MPTVKYKCMDSGKMKTKSFPYNAVGKAQATEFAKTMKKMKTKSFPYNAVGKAQATEFAKTMKGSIKNNPNKKMTESGY